MQQRLVGLKQMIIQQMQLQQGKPCLLVRMLITFHIVFHDTKLLHRTLKEMFTNTILKRFQLTFVSRLIKTHDHEQCASCKQE